MKSWAFFQSLDSLMCCLICVDVVGLQVSFRNFWYNLYVSFLKHGMEYKIKRNALSCFVALHMYECFSYI